MAQALTMDEMREVAAAARAFQRQWDASKNHAHHRYRLLKHFEKLPGEWQETFVKFLEPTTVTALSR